MIDLVAFLKKRLIGAQLLLAYIWRIADHDIEARSLTKRLALAIKEYVGKFEFPVEEMFPSRQHGRCVEPVLKRLCLRMFNGFPNGIICQWSPNVAADLFHVVVEGAAQVCQVKVFFDEVLAQFLVGGFLGFDILDTGTRIMLNCRNRVQSAAGVLPELVI